MAYSGGMSPYTWRVDRNEKILIWLVRLGSAVMLTAQTQTQRYE